MPGSCVLVRPGLWDTGVLPGSGTKCRTLRLGRRRVRGQCGVRDARNMSVNTESFREQRRLFHD